MARLILLVAAVAMLFGVAPGAVLPVRAAVAPSFLAWWGVFGTGEGQFSSPHGIASDGGELLYVVDTYNDRVQVRQRDGRFIRSFGSRGTGQGQYFVPIAVA